VEGLLRDLGPRLRRGGATSLPAALLATGISEIDRLLGGGFPRGRLSEIAGATSSGRTSLALALLARATAAGEVVAVVDCADAFDPGSAERAGAALERVLWVRAPRYPRALRAAQCLLEAHGFALVLLDLAIPELRSAPATALRLARAAASSDSALVALTRARAMGSAAEIALELAPARSLFCGSPTLLEGLDAQIELVRVRNASALQRASVRLHAAQAAP
jgi:RecA/RadA recombinase